MPAQNGVNAHKWDTVVLSDAVTAKTEEQAAKMTKVANTMLSKTKSFNLVVLGKIKDGILFRLAEL